MKITPFTKYHEENGAKMADFAGYNMPIQFSGINDEHKTVREAVGVFDVSHMGEIWVKGEKAEEFLQYVTSNDVAALKDGKVQYTVFPNGKGGIIDDVLLYRIDAETYMLVTNAANTPKDWAHLCKEGEKFGLTPGKELYNATAEIALLAIQGPNSVELMNKLCKDPVDKMPFYSFIKTDVAGIKDAIVSTTGYTGEKGFEVYIANEDADQLWEALWKAGEEFGLKNIGLGARDTLRLEMGYMLYGNDIGETTSPIEAGLGWVVKFPEGKNFIDRPLFEKQKEEGTENKLIAFEMIERGIPRQGYTIASREGGEIGTVTSGTMSPTLRQGVGMGYVKTPFAQVGQEIAIVVRDKPIAAKIVKPPFVK